MPRTWRKGDSWTLQRVSWIKQAPTTNPTSYYDPINTDALTRRYDRERCTDAHLFACTHPLTAVQLLEREVVP